MKKLTIVLLLLFSSCFIFSQKNAATEKPIGTLFSDDFDTLDTSVWIAEIARQPNSRVYTANGSLILDTKGGVTVWLNKKLAGNIRIEYTRKVLVDSGSNDRLSDLNTFWMATDPHNENLFTRDGIFESYDNLQLYYVGMGGNSNTTTRFRKYEGVGGEKAILKEYSDPQHLLEANKTYHIVIIVKNMHVTYMVNDEVYFSYRDPNPLKEGYFGFRSTKSRQAIDDIRIFQLQ